MGNNCMEAPAILTLGGSWKCLGEQDDYVGRLLASPFQAARASNIPMKSKVLFYGSDLCLRKFAHDGRFTVHSRS